MYHCSQTDCKCAISAFIPQLEEPGKDCHLVLTSSIRRRWKKLASLSLGEIRSRSAQAFHKRSDLLLSRFGLPMANGTTGPAGKFFFDSAEIPALLDCLRNELPGAVQDVISRADRICEHEFDLLGYHGLKYGKVIDWHKDAVSGKIAPQSPWYKIQFLRYDRVGDVKVTWELNRHQHLVILAKAFLLTGNERYVTELIQQWRSWQRDNPYPYGVNWASSLEVAFRSLSWLWIRALLRDATAVPGDFWTDLDRAINLSARHVERYLSTYFSPNTHLIGEGVALFFVGTLTSSSPARHWQELGWQIVLSEADRQVQSDGFHFEQSTYYHVYTVDLFLHSYLLARANGILIPKDFGRRIVSMLDALAAISKSGPVPRFGDDDGGRLFDGQRNHASHLVDPLAIGAALFRRSDFKAHSPNLTEELVWLLGLQGARDFSLLDIGLTQPDPFQALPASGIYILTDATKNQRLVFDAGKQGAHGGGHSHADALSVQFAIHGKEVLTDPGTYVYVSPEDHRQNYRSTPAHNTVVIDGQDQMIASGPFPWASKADVSIDHSIRGGNFTFLRASQRGYQRLADPVTHTRTVFHLDGGFWFVHDCLRGSQVHDVQSDWRLIPGLSFDLQQNYAKVECEGVELRLDFAQDSPLNRELVTGMYSPVYGQQQPCKVLRFSGKIQLPASLAIAISAPASESKPGLSSIETLSQSVYVYRAEPCTYTLLNRTSGDELSCNSISADAEFLCFGRSTDNSSHLIICGARTVRVNGHLLFQGEPLVDYFEATFSSSGLHQWSLPVVSCDSDLLGEIMTKAPTTEMLGARG